MNPAKSAAKPAAPGVQPSYTQVNPGTGRIIHNGKSYRVILHYYAGTKELNTEEQLNRIKKILDLSRIGKNEKLSDITIEDGKVFRTKEPIERKLSKVAGVNVDKTLKKIKKTFDKVILNAGIAPPADEAAASAKKPVSTKGIKAAAPAADAAAKPAADAAAKPAADAAAKPAADAAAKPAAAKPKAQQKIELETDDETASVDGEEASQKSEQEVEEVGSDGASSTDNSESGDEDFNDIDAAANAAAKPVAHSQAKSKAPAAKLAAKPAAESEVEESERPEVSEAAESDKDEVKVGEGTTVEFVAADLLGHDEIPQEVINKVVASTKVPAEKIKGYIPTQDHNTVFRAYGMSFLVALYHKNDFTEFEDIVRDEIVKLSQTEQDKILQEYGRFLTDLNDLRTHSLVEFLEFLESEQNDKLLCQLLRSLVRKEVNPSDTSQIKKEDLDELLRIFNFGFVTFPPRNPIGTVDFDKSLWLYKTKENEFAILLRVADDEDESKI
jgi:hypothetical protein